MRPTKNPTFEYAPALSATIRAFGKAFGAAVDLMFAGLCLGFGFTVGVLFFLTVARWTTS